MTDVRSRVELMESALPLGGAIDFLRLVWAVDHALQRRSKSMAVTIGITGPQRLVIRIIGRFPSIHAKQLADILHLHPSSLTGVLKRLERRRLVRRWPDGRDRRRWLLGLTRQGQTLNRDTPGTIEAAVQRTLKMTGRRDLDGARVVLSRLAHELHDRRRGVNSRAATGRTVSAGRRRRAVGAIDTSPPMLASRP